MYQFRICKSLSVCTTSYFLRSFVANFVGFGGVTSHGSVHLKRNQCRMAKLDSSSKRKILCMGDSLTEGWYEDGAKFHPYTICLESMISSDVALQGKFEVVNEGLSSECVIGEMTERMKNVLLRVKPLCLVIILGGTNDIASLSKCRTRDLPSHIKSLHKQVHDLGVKTCALTLPDADVGYLPMTYEFVEYREEINEGIRTFANENQDKVILCDIAYEHPMLSLSEEERKKLWDDDLHCTPAGYDKMGEIIFHHIKSFLYTLL